MDVYSAWVHLARNRAEWKRLKKTTELPLSDINSFGLTQREVTADNGTIHICVYLDTESHQGEDLIELIGHEAVHASGLLLDHAGVEYDGNSEALAYLNGWFTKWLWEQCHDH